MRVTATERPYTIYARPDPSPEGWVGTRLGGSFAEVERAVAALEPFQGIAGLEVWLAYRGQRLPGPA